MAFYNPALFKIEGRPIIAYFDDGLGNVLGRSEREIEYHLYKIQIGMNKLVNTIELDYQIVFLWNTDDRYLMTDDWVFSQTDKWGSGPLADVKIFRDLNLVEDIGVASGNTLRVLGREEAHRSDNYSNNLHGYLNDPRPKLPDSLSLNQDFILR